MYRYIRMNGKFSLAFLILITLIGVLNPVLSQPSIADIDITLRVYPEGEVGIEIDGAIELGKIQGVADFILAMRSYIARGDAESVITLNLTFDYPTILQLPDAELHITCRDYKANGTLYLESSRMGAGKMTLSGGFTAIYDNDTDVVDAIFNATLIIPYSLMSRSKIQEFINQFDALRGIIHERIDEWSCGNVTLVDLTLESMFESDRAILIFQGELEGNLKKALFCKAKFAVPVKMYLSNEFLERLKHMRYTEFDSFTLDLVVNSSDGTLKLVCRLKFMGDVERQVNEVKNMYVNYVKDLFPNVSSKFYVFCKEVLGETSLSAKALDLTVTYSGGDGGLLKFSFTGLKVKPPAEAVADGFKFHELFSKLADLAPEGIADVDFVIEAGSTENEFIEIEAPPYVQFAEKSRHRIVFRGVNFTDLGNLTFKVAPNTWGVADAKIHEIKGLIAGEQRKIIAITNSTIRRFQYLADKIELEVEGLRGTKGALNVTIPKETVTGKIFVYVDGNIVKAAVSANETHYFVYAKYAHSIHEVVIRWGLPQLSLTASAEEIYAGETVILSGFLAFEGEPVPDIGVSLYVNGELVGTTVTGANGEYAFTQVFRRVSTYNCKVVCETYDVESDVKAVRVLEVLGPSMMTYVLAVAVVIIVIASAMLIMRRK